MTFANKRLAFFLRQVDNEKPRFRFKETVVVHWCETLVSNKEAGVKLPLASSILYKAYISSFSPFSEGNNNYSLISTHLIHSDHGDNDCSFYHDDNSW